MLFGSITAGATEAWLPEEILLVVLDHVLVELKGLVVVEVLVMLVGLMEVVVIVGA
jgi:hypothetical protein